MIPAAFEAVRDHGNGAERYARAPFRERVHRGRLLEQAMNDFAAIFGLTDFAAVDVTDEVAPALWDGGTIVGGGINHGGDLGGGPSAG